MKNNHFVKPIAWLVTLVLLFGLLPVFGTTMAEGIYIDFDAEGKESLDLTGAAGNVKVINAENVKEITYPAAGNVLTGLDLSGCAALTEIAGSALANQSALTEVKLPESVKVIGDKAFLNCASLLKIDLTKVTEIKKTDGACIAFEGCDSLAEVVMPGGKNIKATADINGKANLQPVSLTEVKAAANAGEGYEFDAWEATSGITADDFDVSADSVTITMPDADAVIKALFKEIPEEKTPKIDDIMKYTVTEGIIIAAPTADEITALIKAAGYNSVMLLDCSDVADVTGIELKLDLALFTESNKALKIILSNGLELTINSGNWNEFVKLTDGKEITISLKAGSISITCGDEEIAWYSYENPMIIAHPFQSGDEYTVLRDTADESVITRSWYADGKVYAKIYNAGEFEALKTEIAKFTDTDGKWMDAAVRYAAARGIVKGTGGELFTPDRSVTRAEFITILMRALNVKINEVDAEAFADAASIPEYAKQSIAGAAALGVVKGDENRNFNPSATITRQDMFVMVYRAMEKLNMTPDFYTLNIVIYTDDDQVADYAYETIQNLSKLGIIKGSDGAINPKGTSSRAEATQVIYNVLAREKNS